MLNPTNNLYDKSYFEKRKNITLKIKAFIFAIIIRFFFHPKNLLDLGCAEGYLINYATLFGIDAKGVDISKDAISSTEPAFQQKCQVADILNLPFSDNNFQVVSCLAVLEHIPKENTDKALKEIIRVAKKYIILQICVEDNPFEKNNCFLDPTHVNLKESNWWIKKFQELNLKVLLSLSKLGIFFLKKE